MDSPVATANMPAASAHFAARKVEKDLIRAESIRIMKANAPAAIQYFGKKADGKKAAKEAKIAKSVAEQEVPAATLHFGKLNEQKKAEKEAKLAAEAAKYEAPAATQYFNAKKAASTRNL